jgi:FAD/FMN-containing dehydrogenase
LPGFAVCDDGVMIDLEEMTSVRVDAAAQTARAEAGVNWGQFDHETQAFGLATTGGVVRTTGIAGLTLAGGHGFLMRRFGLSCDNLLSADVLTADGRIVKASADENTDLFWAMRGGGGNFGIVTSFEYRLHRVGPVLGGLLLFPFDEARRVLRFYDGHQSGCPSGVLFRTFGSRGPGSASAEDLHRSHRRPAPSHAIHCCPEHRRELQSSRVSELLEDGLRESTE